MDLSTACVSSIVLWLIASAMSDTDVPRSFRQRFIIYVCWYHLAVLSESCSSQHLWCPSVLKVLVWTLSMQFLYICIWYKCWLKYRTISFDLAHRLKYAGKHRSSRDTAMKCGLLRASSSSSAAAARSMSTVHCSSCAWIVRNELQQI